MTISTAPGSARVGHRRGAALSERSFLFFLLAPGVLLLAGVVLYPLIRSLASAFFEESLLYPGAVFVGLNNVAEVMSTEFIPLTTQTLIFTVGSTVAPFVLGLALALVLNQRFRGQTFLRGAFLIPWLIPGVVVSFLWMWIFDANYGVLNGILMSAGMIDSPIAWLFQTDTARAALIVAKTWNSFPWIMVMLLAGLQAVPVELHEAAAMDGAGAIRRFFAVTWPHISGIAGLVVLLEFIWNFQHFDMIFVLTGGGPAGTTATYATAVYDTAFKGYDLGHAGALGLVWMLLLSVLVVIYVWLSERGEREMRTAKGGQQ
ncbi:multiple sugar transport system permease protein [Microbacterium halimionae]|uniref:Multiple sugar transport system permease protein n=1 Tax=Microbacterium halimionae TaxID=1526413 RepID=A0A7W3PLP4_9MICO|nr:sugar ABC transporter permease [Microbacterium halimionae]MBA8816780.1 multiple sugar transport system permease protein [Microbacterium halimionae]NII94924.1 multiple sugar transport system permease protein [Microbacterium halimionae]